MTKRKAKNVDQSKILDSVTFDPSKIYLFLKLLMELWVPERRDKPSDFQFKKKTIRAVFPGVDMTSSNWSNIWG